MRESACFVVAVAMLTLAVPYAAGIETGAADAGPSDGAFADVCGDRELHPPIHVTDRGPLGEDDPRGFVVENPVTGEAEYRPGSGVVAGDGSKADPYVIEGWCIVGWWEAAVGSVGESTDVFNPLTNGQVDTALATLRGTGIHLDTDAHVVVQDVLVAGFGTGLQGASSPNVILTDSEIRGNVWGVTQVPVVRENTLTENRHGISYSSPDALRNPEITRNTIVDNTGFGITAHSAPDGTMVTENVVSRNRAGVELTGLDLLLESNTVTENEGTGISLESHQWHISGDIRNNAVVDNGGPGMSIAGGLTADLSPITLRGNNIHGNVADLGGTGVEAEGEEGSLDARDNWWGCPDGPVLSPGLTECQLVSGPVDYDPWLTEPNPEAGASWAQR